MTAPSFLRIVLFYEVSVKLLGGLIRIDVK